MLDADRVGLLCEQVDHRCAMQPQMLGLQALQQARGVRVAADVRHHQMQLQAPGVAAGRPQRAPQCRQVDVEEIEFLGEGEVFGQQPVGGMRARRRVDQRLVGGKTHLAQRHGGQPLPDAGPRAFQIRCRGMQEQRVAERGDEGRLAVQIDPQRIERQRVETAPLALVFERDRQCTGCALGQHGGGRRHRRAPIAGLGNADRGKRHVVRGTKAAFDPVDRPRAQHRAARHRHRRGQLRGRATDVEVRDGAGRKRPQVMRIHDLQQRFGQFRVVVVELLADARRQEGEGLDHPLDVRIVATVGRHGEPPRDLRISLGEVARIPAQVGQFTLVVRQ